MVECHKAISSKEKDICLETFMFGKGLNTVPFIESGNHMKSSYKFHFAALKPSPLLGAFSIPLCSNNVHD